MRDVIRCSLEGLIQAMRPVADQPIVLLCHSQGAALTYRLLRQEWPDILDRRRVTLLTYGSAVVPIHVLEYRYRSGASRRLLSGIAAFLGLVSLLGLAVLLVRSAALADTPGFLWVLAAFGLGAATLSALSDARCLDGGARPAVRKFGSGDRMTVDELEHDMVSERSSGDGPANDAPQRAIRRMVNELTRPDGCDERLFIPGLNAGTGGLRWVDLYAAWDPVPNGSLLLAEPRAIPIRDPGRYRTLQPTWTSGGVVLPESYLVSNDHQPWLDHVTYRTNVEDVVSRFAMEAAATVSGAAPDLSAFEHRLASGNAPGSGLANPAAEAGRRGRQHRGWWLFGGQLVALVLAVAAMTLRRERLPDLGDWALARLPRPLVSALAGLIDMVPTQVRDWLAGGTRDPSHGYGLTIALVTVAGLLLLQFAVVRSWQGRATELFARGDESPGRAWWLAKALVVVLVIGPALVVWAQVPEAARTPPTVVTVSIDGIPVPGVVTIQPLGEAAERALEVEVPVEGSTVRLRGERLVVSDVDSPGGKDCSAQYEPGIILVTCAPTSEPFAPDG